MAFNARDLEIHCLTIEISRFSTDSASFNTILMNRLPKIARLNVQLFENGFL